LILQIGAATDGNINRSFVELYNKGDEPVDLTGYSLQYATGTRETVAANRPNANTEDGPWQKIDINGTILPKHSFLILGEAQTTAAADSPPALAFQNDYGDMNLTGFNLSNRSIKVALMSNTVLLDMTNPFDIDGQGTKADGYVDMIGVMNTIGEDRINGFETAAGPTFSKQVGVRRKNLEDTDNNSVDFGTIRFSDFVTKSGGLITAYSKEYEMYRPKSLAHGAWDPFLKEDDDPIVTDPILAGTADELAGKLLIMQAYGSSNDAAGASHSFVELYNNTDNVINLSGITLFYADGIRGLPAREAGIDSDWRAIPLSGTIPAKTSFLVLGPRQNTTGRLQIINNSGDINEPGFTLSNRAFKVALIRNKNEDLTVQNPFTMDGGIGEIADGYIDMIGSANDLAHATNPDNIFGFETSPARNSASAAVRRSSLVDNDDNSTDFASIDYRVWTESNQDRTTNEQLEIFRPKNIAFGPWNPETGEQYDPGDDGVIAQAITSFKFANKSIGWGDDGYWEGVIDDDAKTITFTTQRWIDNIDKLAAVFELDENGTARVGARPQWSGITQNDFRREVVYTVGDNQYTVKFVSPQATGLPVIKIGVDRAVGSIPHSSTNTWANMPSFVLSDPNNSVNDILRMGLLLDDRIRGRGNTTWSYAKKPYRIRFREDMSLFGLNARENWILLAEYQDPTFLMNATAFELGRNVFDYQPFTNTYQHVHLYMNGEYWGVYGLTEHRQADPKGVGAPGRAKVDLNNGGWFVELDSYFDTRAGSGDPGFRTTDYNLPILIKAPNFPEFPNNGVIPTNVDNFVRNEWNELTALMASANFPENGYRDLIDMNTFVDFLMANEIVRNGELGHPKSVFAYRESSNEKISMGMLWDFDWAFNYAGSGHRYFGSGSGSGRLLGGVHSFFNRFIEDPIFVAMYKERWNEKYDEILAVSEFIETLGETIRDGVAEDSKRWNFSGGYRADYDINHARQTANMKNWWNNRAIWLNTELNKVDILPASRNFGTVTFNNDYSDITPQTFTLVSYGEMTNLSSTFQKGASSAFEIIDILTQNPTGKGGYLATIGIRPKNSLSAGTHTDVLVLSGTNQGNPFTHNIPLTFVVNKATREFVALQPINETYSPTLTLGSFTLPDGYRWGAGVVTSVTLNAGSGQTFSVVYFCEEGNYNDAAGTITVNVAKADPAYTTLANLTATYGDLLSSVTLPNGYMWEGDETGTVGSVGTRTHRVTFTPADTDNYNVITGISVTIEVSKANPSYTMPTGLTAIYGAALSSVTLPSGWSWKSTGTVGNAGTRTHSAIFTPADESNYNVMTDINVAVTVSKADPVYTVPDGLTAAYGERLSSITLPAGWSWESIGRPVGNAGTQTHRAVFTPVDIVNYNIVTGVNVSLTVAKVNPSYTAPTSLTAIYGAALSSVTLPTGWSWENTGTVGNAGTQTHKAVFTPVDIVNYNVMTDINLTIAVSRAIPPYTVPDDLTAIFGQTLADVELPTGWSWDGEKTGTVGNVGTRTHRATFTPVDTVNYNIMTGINVTITIERVVAAVLSPDRVIPNPQPNKEEKLPSLVSFESLFTAGPNPADRQSGMVNFFWQGKRIESTALTVFDASGNVVNRIKTKDTKDGNSRRIVGTWDLKDTKGRLVSEGTYLVRGIIVTFDGKKERISLMIGVK